MAPEEDLSILTKEIGNISWDVGIIGFGIRGSNRTDLTIHFAGKIRLY
jgi:hypothetical protein